MGTTTFVCWNLPHKLNFAGDILEPGLMLSISVADLGSCLNYRSQLYLCRFKMKIHILFVKLWLNNLF